MEKQKLAWGFKELAGATSLSHWTLRKAAQDGKLETFKVGRRRLISQDAAQKFLKKDK